MERKASGFRTFGWEGVLRLCFDSQVSVQGLRVHGPGVKHQASLRGLEDIVLNLPFLEPQTRKTHREHTCVSQIACRLEAGTPSQAWLEIRCSSLAFPGLPDVSIYIPESLQHGQPKDPLPAWLQRIPLQFRALPALPSIRIAEPGG